MKVSTVMLGSERHPRLGIGIEGGAQGAGTSSGMGPEDKKNSLFIYIYLWNSIGDGARGLVRTTHLGFELGLELVVQFSI